MAILLEEVVLPGGLPPLGAMLGLTGSRNVAKVVYSAGTSIDWDTYDTDRIRSTIAFQKIVSDTIDTSARVIEKMSAFSLAQIKFEVPHITQENIVDLLRSPTLLMQDVIMSMPEVAKCASEGTMWGYGLSNEILDTYTRHEISVYEEIVSGMVNFVDSSTECADDDDYTSYTEFVFGGGDGDALYDAVASNIALAVNVGILMDEVRVLMANTTLDPTAIDNDRG